MNIRKIGLIACAVTALAACGDSASNNGDNNGANNGDNNGANNGGTNNGGTNNGATNNGATNNGATNNGATNNGATNNGGTNNGGTNNGGTNNGGTNNGGTNNGTTGALTCQPSFGAADACGGDPSGAWAVTEVCTDYDFEAALQQACATATVSNVDLQATGTLSVAAGLFTNDAQGTASITMNVPADCNIAGCGTVEAALGFIADSASCADGAAGDCDCMATFTVSSGSAGTYTTMNGVATVDSGEEYYYCVGDATMLLREIPQDANEPSAVFLLEPQ